MYKSIILQLLYCSIITATISPQSSFWQKIESPTSEIIESIVRTPEGRIFAGIWLGDIYFSDDGGIQWEHFRHGCNVSFHDIIYGNDGNLYTSSVSDICVFKPDGNFLYAKHFETFIWELALNTQFHLYAIASDSGIIRTTNQGETWEINILYPDSNIIPTSIAIDQSDNIFVSTLNGVYRSTDNGNTWSNVYPTISQIKNIMIAGNGDIFASTYYKIIKSSDNGNTWEFVGNGIPANAQISEIRENDASELFLIAYQGNTYRIYRSSDWGINWYNVSTPLDISITGFLPINSKVLLATGNQGTPASGSYIADLTDSTLISIHLVSGDVSNFLRNESGNFYAKENKFSLSTNNGMLWKNFDYTSTPLENIWLSNDGEIVLTGGNGKAGVVINSTPHLYWTLGGYQSPVKSIIHDPESNYVFAATWEIYYPEYKPGGLYRGVLDYSPANWSALTGGLPSDKTADLLSINYEGQIFVAVNGEIYRTDDKGSSWFLKNAGLENLYLRNIVSDYRGYTFVTVLDYVYRTTNQGDSWVKLNNEFSSIVDIVVDNANNLYVAESDEIFRSTDGGESWVEYGNGLFPTIYIRGLFIDHENYLYAYGIRGVYRSRESLTFVNYSSNNFPQKYTLSQNYPNPFNPSTVISYRLPVIGFVTLKVYDLLGREIATLVNEEKTAGEYEVVFDASMLSSGIYYYVLKCGTFRSIKKMVLLR